MEKEVLFEGNFYQRSAEAYFVIRDQLIDGVCMPPTLAGLVSLILLPFTITAHESYRAFDRYIFGSS